jgi:hypothetical protein
LLGDVNASATWVSGSRQLSAAHKAALIAGRCGRRCRLVWKSPGRQTPAKSHLPEPKPRRPSWSGSSRQIFVVDSHLDRILMLRITVISTLCPLYQNTVFNSAPPDPDRCETRTPDPPGIPLLALAEIHSDIPRPPGQYRENAREQRFNFRSARSISPIDAPRHLLDTARTVARPTWVTRPLT